MFQSSPSSLAGRYKYRQHRYPSAHECFNPRPARWLGATTEIQAGALNTAVSILAQLVGWALHLRSPLLPGHAFPFQSSPSSLAGRYLLILRQTSHHCLFQSSPSSLAGRYSKTVYLLWAQCSFNPRPARWLGATVYCSMYCLARSGFNPRPARWLGATLYSAIFCPAQS